MRTLVPGLNVSLVALRVGVEARISEIGFSHKKVEKGVDFSRGAFLIQLNSPQLHLL